MTSKTRQRKTKGRKAKPVPSSENDRARLRTAGLRRITMWVPDMHSPKFAAEARRQCLLANNSRYAAADQAWVNSMTGWKSD